MIIEMMIRCGQCKPFEVAWSLIKTLKLMGVEYEPDQAPGITDEGSRCDRTGEDFIPADTVIMATGVIPVMT